MGTNNQALYAGEWVHQLLPPRNDETIGEDDIEISRETQRSMRKKSSGSSHA